MTLLITLALVLGLLSASQSTYTGHALYYGKGQMERVYRVRIQQHLVRPGWTGSLAAVPNCSHIGEIVSARINGGLWARYLVVDCAQPYDYRMQIRTGRAIEVDYYSAVRNGFVSKGKAPATVVYTGGKYE